MKCLTAFLTFTWMFNVVAHGDDSLRDWVQFEKGGVGIPPAKLSELHSLASNKEGPNYYAANALLAAHNINSDNNDTQFTNAYRHATEAFHAPEGRWEKIYAGLTLATIEGTCYRQNYTNQIAVILKVLDEIKKTNWEATSNPVYSLFKKNGIPFGNVEIADLMKSQLVNAYCSLGQVESAECATQGISNVEVLKIAKARIELEKQMHNKRKQQGMK